MIDDLQPDPPAKRGRPRKPTDPKTIWDQEEIAIASTAQKGRVLLERQLDKLEQDIEGITSVQQRLKVIESISKVVGELTKNAKLIRAEQAKEPQADTEELDGQAALENILRSQQ